MPSLRTLAKTTARAASEGNRKMAIAGSTTADTACGAPSQCNKEAAAVIRKKAGKALRKNSRTAPCASSQIALGRGQVKKIRPSVNSALKGERAAYGAMSRA